MLSVHITILLAQCPKLYFILSARKEADKRSFAGGSDGEGRAVVPKVPGQGQGLLDRGEQGS